MSYPRVTKCPGVFLIKKAGDLLLTPILTGEPQDGNLGGVIERRRIFRWLSGDGIRKTGDIWWDGDRLLAIDIRALAEGFQFRHEICTREEERIVDDHEPTLMGYQRAHLVDQAGGLAKEVNGAGFCAGEERRIEDHAVK